MDEDGVIGPTVEAKGAVKAVPSLALALLPQPQILAMGDPWRASGDNGDRTEDTAPNAGGGVNDPAGGK